MKYKCLAVFCFVVFLFSSKAASNEHPLGLNENHPYGRLTTDYVTPHVRWANPYYKGKVKVLVLAPTWSQRETIELAQRLSLDFTPWMTATFHEVISPPDISDIGFFQPPSFLVYNLLDEYINKDYDAIIVGKLDWGMLPSNQRFKLLKKISDGTGLIYINPPEHKELTAVFNGENIPEGTDFIAKGIPLSFLPRFKEIKSENLVKTLLFGKGRVVILNYQESPLKKEKWNQAASPCLTPVWDCTDPKEGFLPLEGLPEVELVPYEYYQALLAKAVLWAGNKQPNIQIKLIDLAEKIGWPTSGRRVVIEFENLPKEALISASVRDSKEYEKVYPLGRKKAEEKTSFSLLSLPAGNYFLDIWVLTSDGEKIINWGSKGFSVISDFEFGKITLAKNSFDIGDTIAGEVVLPRLLEENEKIIVSLWDNFNRKIEFGELKATVTSVPFHFSPLKPLTILHRVEMKLLRDEKIVCEKSVPFPVRAKLRWDDFNEVVWAGTRTNFITYLMLKKLASFDEADVIVMPGAGFWFHIYPDWTATKEKTLSIKDLLQVTARNVSQANLSLLPYNWRFAGGGTTDIGSISEWCLNNPELRKVIERNFLIDGEIFGPYQPFCWTHGDESFYSREPNNCWCKYCLTNFRQYLKEKYGTLEALNRDWETNYTVWDEVMPLIFKQAKETGSYARWVEHRLFSDRVFAGVYDYAQNVLEKNDPGVRSGFDGAQEIYLPNVGVDWWLLSKHRGLMHTYNYERENMQIFRSFANQNQVTGMWYGTYGLTGPGGPNTVPYCHFFPWYSLFHQLNTTWFWTMEDPGPISGYGPDLCSLPFFEARRESLKKIKSGIGKLLLTGSRANDRIAIHYSEVSRIVDSLYAINEADWSGGWFQSLGNFGKALKEDNGLQYDYLSYEQIEKGELTRKGFKVFIMPHSRAISEKEAEEIRKFVREGGIVIADILPGIHNGHGTFQKKDLLADIFPVDKQGEITSFGKGKTILIGNFLSGYLGKLLKEEAGIVAKVKITPLKVKEMPPTEITRIRCGEVEFIGLLRESFLNDHNSYAAAITFSRQSHLYDVLEGKYLGFTSQTNTEISYRANLYALSPYKVSAVNLSGLTTAVAGIPTSLKIQVQTEGNAQPSKHAFRVEIVAADGKKLSFYSQNIVAEKGNAEVNIPWALNDQPGKYTVTVRDIMSSITAKQEIYLQAQGPE